MRYFLIGFLLTPCALFAIALFEIAAWIFRL